MEPFNRELAPEAKGGGGGEDEGLIRSRFADTAFWDPVVRTDEDGQAQVEVELPDNLTTWRMQARGITADTQVGRAEVDVLSTLDLLVRPVLPRFFVVGDRAEIATIVHNNTAEALEVQVNISVEGLAARAAQRPRRCSVAAPATRPRSSGRCRPCPATRSRCACGPQRRRSATTAARTPCPSTATPRPRWSPPPAACRSQGCARRSSNCRAPSTRPRAS